MWYFATLRGTILASSHIRSEYRTLKIQIIWLLGYSVSIIQKVKSCHFHSVNGLWLYVVFLGFNFRQRSFQCSNLFQWNFAHYGLWMGRQRILRMLCFNRKTPGTQSVPEGLKNWFVQFSDHEHFSDLLTKWHLITRSNRCYRAYK